MKGGWEKLPCCEITIYRKCKGESEMLLAPHCDGVVGGGSLQPVLRAAKLLAFQASHCSSTFSYICGSVVQQSSPKTPTRGASYHLVRQLPVTILPELCCDPVTKAGWGAVNEKHKAEYPNILGLVDLLSPPVHTTDCGSGFSLMKSTKSDWRNWFGDNVLSSMMWILMRLPSVCDYDPDNAIELWLHRSQRKCCPFQAPYAKEEMDFCPCVTVMMIEQRACKRFVIVVAVNPQVIVRHLQERYGMMARLQQLNVKEWELLKLILDNCMNEDVLDIELNSELVFDASLQEDDNAAALTPPLHLPNSFIGPKGQ
ncbi:hypothetical protein PR048_021637 [Dryococelus australis]|uniref:Uncharacterized protein n=1 Tax=Dryococelus australis TaxID=614101 RepID=A0ABQ9GYR2_9NEOP|nr:hypothetical protein PR048_021637 [Dryococelus australis]